MAGLEGRTLGRYQLQQLIGRGGMADVYLGFDPHFQRDVAIKVFKHEDEGMLKRFMREAKLMASLRNPYLMPVYDLGEAVINGLSRYYIVMPFMEGGTLRARIKRSPLSLKDACRYLREIASALDYIHAQGIIHRDIKSSNVLLDVDGRCYLSDFGIARTATDATQMTSTGEVLGTVDYVAPELFEAERKADARSDFYSLGVLLFEMVTGQMPFKAENQIAVIAMHINQRPPSPRTIVPNLSPQVERVMLRALEKNPDRRYRSATELANAFCQAVAAPAVQEPEPLILRAEPPLPPASKAEGYYPVYDRQPMPIQPALPMKRKRASPSRARAIVLMVIALLTLLAVIGPIFYILLTGAHLNAGAGGTQTTATTAPSTPSQAPAATPNLTATAQAVAANLTQQATNKTATAIAGTTATAQAQVTATAGVIVTATAGKAVYTDTLNNATNADTVAAKWDQNADCTFNQDGYHVIAQTDILRQGTLNGCLESGHSYTNATVTVDMVIQSGHSGGLFFHVTTKSFGAYAGYLFEVDSKGNYKVSRASNYSTGSGYVALQDWTASSAIKTGTAKNTLQVIIRDGSELFYVNGIFLVAVQDTTYPSGNLALLATTSNNGDNAEVVYSNLHVYAA